MAAKLLPSDIRIQRSMFDVRCSMFGVNFHSDVTVLSSEFHSSLHDIRHWQSHFHASHHMNTTSTLRAFRQISHRFSQREARQHFVCEILLFALLTIISAWPMIGAIDALSRSLR